MKDEAFVEFCYRQILRRDPDEDGKQIYTNALRSRKLSREDVLIRFVTSPEFTSRAALPEFVPTGHFFSAIPSREDKEAYLASAAAAEDPLAGLDLNAEAQTHLLRQFKRYHDECPFPRHKTAPYRYYFSNPAYAQTDALTLYSMMRHFRPRKIVEIGSGFSSCVMLDTNDHFFDGELAFTFIEPYPALLHSLLGPADTRHAIVPRKIQEADPAPIHQLSANDILVVDSTHVSKLKSDVNKIFFDLLPSLQKGVLVHFHDIFWNFEYPKVWIREGRCWNESYLLRTFLQFNRGFEIVFFSDYLHHHQQPWIAENLPLYLQNTGGNMWIRKTAD